jgi:glycosyltransferase involved in cell wall biosynthesis
VISFVITAREERAEVLRRTIEELRATTPRREREILIVDDGSSTPVAGLAREVQVVRNAQPIGVSRARRRGCALASGDVLVCLDAHMSFGEGWLDRMLAHVESGALLCSAFWDYDRETCHCFGADFEWCGQRDYDAQRYPGFRFRHRVRPPARAAVEVSMAIGACYMLLRSSYEALGGFCPLFRVWGADEQDLSARAWMAGLGVRCVTGACVGHLWRPAFPYPVHFEDLEFNQLALIHSVFDEETIELLCRAFAPLPERVREWLDERELAAWREVVQSARRYEDEDFFLRFVPGVHALRAQPPI